MNIHAIDEVKDGAADSRPVLAIRFGRGRTGGSTFWIFWSRGRDERAGRSGSLTAMGIMRRFRPGILLVESGARFGRAVRISAMWWSG